MPLTPFLLLTAVLGCGADDPPSAPPAAPAPVPVPSPEPVPTGPSPEAVSAALEKAHGWLAAYSERIRFDATLGTFAVGALRGEPWPTLHQRLVSQAQDPDHEHRRLFDPTYTLPAEHVLGWEAPAEGRANPNRVVTEALFCSDHGWRPATDAYTCGPMRDQGGYQSTHALWALSIARDQGCLKGPSCIPALVDELSAAQPEAPTPERSLDLDLYAERLLMRCLVDQCGDGADEAGWLVQLQDPDGSWGVPAEGEDPYHRYHATMMAAWALAEWDAQRTD